MKKITLILIATIGFISAYAQHTVPRGLPSIDTKYVENKGLDGASALFDSLIMFKNMGDTQMKPLSPALGYIENFAGDSTFWIWDMVRWKKFSSGGGGSSFSLTTIGGSPNANGASYNSGTGVFNLQPYSRAFGGITTASATPQYAQGQKSIFSNTDTIASYYGSEVLRSRLLSLGIQQWWLNNGATESGSIAFTTPVGTPGVAFFNTSGTGRSQIRQYVDTGGISLGAESASTVIAGNQLVVLNNGHTFVTGFTPTIENRVGDSGYLFNVFGTSNLWGKLYLSSVNDGSSGDSVLVINNTEVKKVPFNGNIPSSDPQWSVISILNTPPVSPTTGDVYLVGTVPTGAFIGHTNEIATWSGSAWTFQTATSADQLYNQSNTIIYKYTGSAWIALTRALIHQGGDAFGADMVIGTTDAKFLRFRTNGSNRMSFSSTGTTTINSLTGAAAGIVGASTTGQLSNVQKGFGINITSSSISVDTSVIPTRYTIDSLALASGNLTWQQTLDVGSTLNKNNSIDVGGHNFTMTNIGSYTISSDDIFSLSTVSSYSLSSIGDGSVLATGTLLEKGGTGNYLAGTTAGWGYASSSAVTLGFTATSTTLTGVGIPDYASGTVKFLAINTSTGAVTKKSIAASDVTSGAALTKVDDANVTATLGGTPASALLAPVSITLGWTGQLSVARGGTGQSSYTDGQLLIGNSSGNTLTKATLTAGSGITITNGNGSITIATSGSSGVASLSAIGSSPNANGATITGTVLNLEPASASFGGVVTTGTQTFAGAKTFTQGVNDAFIISGTETFTANNQRHVIFNPSVTLRATASDVGVGMELSPTITSGAATQTGIALKINPTFTSTGGAFSNQIAIQHTGDIVPITSNAAKLGSSSISYSTLFVVTANTGAINFTNAAASPSTTLVFTNQQGTGSTMFSHGHQVWGEGNNGTVDDSSQLHAKGGVEFNGVYLPKLAAETISSVTNGGVTGATTYTYVVVAYCFNGTASVSAAVSTTTGNATLSGSNFNTITWTQVVGAYRYDVYRTVGGASQGKIIARPQSSTAYNDQSGSGADGASPPAVSLNNTGSIKLDGGLFQSATITAGGTTGAQTINKAAGCVNFAASATSLVVTNNFVATTSLVHAWVQTNDATLFSCQTVPASGSFTIFANAAATAETKVCFEVINTY